MFGAGRDAACGRGHARRIVGFGAEGNALFLFVLAGPYESDFWVIIRHGGILNVVISKKTSGPAAFATGPHDHRDGTGYFTLCKFTPLLRKSGISYHFSLRAMIGLVFSIKMSC